MPCGDGRRRTTNRLSLALPGVVGSDSLLERFCSLSLKHNWLASSCEIEKDNIYPNQSFNSGMFAGGFTKGDLERSKSWVRVYTLIGRGRSCSFSRKFGGSASLDSSCSGTFERGKSGSPTVGEWALLFVARAAMMERESQCYRRANASSYGHAGLEMISKIFIYSLMTNFTLKHFILKQQVIHLYRHAIRASRGPFSLLLVYQHAHLRLAISDPVTRRETCAWIRSEFDRNRSLTDAVRFQSILRLASNAHSQTRI